MSTRWYGRLQLLLYHHNLPLPPAAIDGAMYVEQPKLPVNTMRNKKTKTARTPLPILLARGRYICHPPVQKTGRMVPPSLEFLGSRPPTHPRRPAVAELTITQGRYTLSTFTSSRRFRRKKEERYSGTYHTPHKGTLTPLLSLASSSSTAAGGLSVISITHRRYSSHTYCLALCRLPS